ncbi:hypothetical protein BDV98DRAFT_574962 [Pterulicium gracile]|uniref:Uncharacterized protein n=1 Tax=Pterulicium gracile TaxID=1884261 RepID=A0A5C3Q9S9_9AGAR|nr:hypothetical protein BDV98DRAFT_574962 [Pterula gracilis]
MKFFAIALSLLATLSLASPLDKRECASIPSTPDRNVLKQVYQVAKSRGVSEKVMLATFATCWVESHCHSLPCGDKDSYGVFQQRPSQGWGSKNQLMNVEYATNKFLDLCIPTAAKNPHLSAGTIAQMVQRSEYPHRYNQQVSKAHELLARVRR